MSVYIDIAIFGSNRRHRFFCSHFNTRRLFNRTRFVTDIINDTPSVQCQQIGRFTGIQINHCPYGTGISYLFPIFIDHCKVTICKKTVHILHPCLNAEFLILVRHFIQLDSQTRKYPSIIILIQGCNPKTTVTGMKARTVQQMITQYSHRQTSVKIYMKRFCNKSVSSYFIIFTHLPVVSYFDYHAFPGRQGIHSPVQNNW